MKKKKKDYDTGVDKKDQSSRLRLLCRTFTVQMKCSVIAIQVFVHRNNEITTKAWFAIPLYVRVDKTWPGLVDPHVKRNRKFLVLFKFKYGVKLKLSFEIRTTI